MDGWDGWRVMCNCMYVRRVMETMGKGKMVAFPICQLIWMQKAKEMGDEKCGKTQMYLIILFVMFVVYWK